MKTKKKRLGSLDTEQEEQMLVRKFHDRLTWGLFVAAGNFFMTTWLAPRLLMARSLQNTWHFYSGEITDEILKVDCKAFYQPSIEFRFLCSSVIATDPLLAIIGV